MHTAQFSVDTEECFQRLFLRWLRRKNFLYYKVSTENQAKYQLFSCWSAAATKQKASQSHNES